MTSRSTAPKRSGATAGVRVGDEVELSFTDLLANGQAVGRVGGLVVFCFGPLPEERARVAIESVKPKYAVGKLLRLLEGSPHRAQPFCEAFGACGGCQIQHLAYPEQLRWKADMVRSALARIGGLSDVRVHPTVAMLNPRAYRNKMSLVVDHRYTTPTIGFYQARSHDVVPIERCPIVAPQLSEYIGRLNLARMNAVGAGALQDARHVVARIAQSTGEAVVTLTTLQPSQAAADAAPTLLRALPGAVGVTNSFDPSSANAIVGRSQRVLAGRGAIDESIAGIRYRVSAGSFFQVNVEIVERIFALLERGFARPRKIVDLYCGVGTFSLFFARHGSEVLGIEENAQAVAEAEVNARLNALEGGTRFLNARVEDAVGSDVVRAALDAAQIVFLDPPRKGSEAVVLAAIASAQVPNVWYLSCDPATLARDLKVLTGAGYRVGLVQPFDMFPQTGHVETLVTLYSETGAARSTVEAAFAGEPPPAAWPADDRYANDRLEYPDFVFRED